MFRKYTGHLRMYVENNDEIRIELGGNVFRLQHVISIDNLKYCIKKCKESENWR